MQIVALYNRTRSKADALAAEFGIPAVYSDPDELLNIERPDAIDIITDPATHARFVNMAAERRVPVVCQKPLSTSLREAEGMLQTCARTSTPFIVHENFRWQAPLRQLKEQLSSGVIGTPFRARIQFSSSFPVFEDQPFLRSLEQFILTDVGSHILDVARFLLGDAQTIYCRTSRINSGIKGEDVATVMLQHGNATSVCEMGYASSLERERHPQTFVLIEGDKGSLELAPDYWVRCTTPEGTLARRYPPPRYAWADPRYDLVHSSIVACNANILAALKGGPPAETDANDNIKTIRLVFAAYESAATGRSIALG